MTRLVLGLDPGTRQSALVMWDGARVHFSRYAENDDLRLFFRERAGHDEVPTLAIEKFESMGMAVGMDVFETVRWAGRFEEAWYPLPVVLVARHAVKLHLCHSRKAKDANVRTSLMDRFGGAAAVGTKKQPGPLYGVSGHGWAALAVAVTAWDQLEGRP